MQGVVGGRVGPAFEPPQFDSMPTQMRGRRRGSAARSHEDDDDRSRGRRASDHKGKCHAVARPGCRRCSADRSRSLLSMASPACTIRRRSSSTTAGSTSTAPAPACRSRSPTTAGPGGAPAALMQAVPGWQARPRRARARRQQHLGAGRHPGRATTTSSTTRRRARSRSPRSGCWSARRSIPSSPDYKWEDGGPIVWSDGVEDSNAIDPGVFRDPTNGTLWLTYGSYFGYIRLVRAQSEDRQAAVSRAAGRSTSRSTPKPRS